MFTILLAFSSAPCEVMKREMVYYGLHGVVQ